MSCVNHILDCIYRYQKDFGESPVHIRITCNAFRELSEDVLRNYDHPETAGTKLIFLKELNPNGGSISFAGIPLLVIPNTRQEELKF